MEKIKPPNAPSLHHRLSSTCSTAVAGHRGKSAESGGSSESPFEQVAPQSPGEGSLGERTSESTEPQGHAHTHSRGIGARGSRARESVKPPREREKARFPAKPIPRTKQGPDRFKQDLKGVPDLGIPTSSHTRASGELGRSASLLGPGFVSSSHCGFPKGLKKKKQIRVPAVGMPEVFWARGNDLSK